MWFRHSREGQKRNRRRPITHLPRLEILEDRCLPSGAPGTLDPSFGAAGLATGPTGRGVAIQPDGKIVVVGTASNAIEVIRYTSSGSLDSTFGSGGIVTTQTGKFRSQGMAVAVQGDGKIVAAGYAYNSYSSKYGYNYAITMVRYNSDGSLDQTFGGHKGGGIVATDITPNIDVPSGVALQPDGKIVVVGHAGEGILGAITPTPLELVVLRYDTNGSLDSTFGTGGIAALRQGVVESGSSVAVQPDGSIVAGAYQGNVASQAGAAVVRFTAAGQLDSTFGSGGIATFTLAGATNYGTPSVAVQSGNIVALGTASYSSGNQIYLTRFTTTGQLDTSFGSSGFVTNSAFSSTAATGAVQVAGNGDLLVAGTSTSATPTGTPDFALAAYLPTGALDTTFGTNGVTTTDFNNSSDSVSGMAIQSDGNIVLAGNPGLARYFGLGAPLFAVSAGAARHVTLGTAPPTAKWVMGGKGSVTSAATGEDRGHVVNFATVARRSPRAVVIDWVFADG
jgi:uncharacterized delta-60 repeat protein